MPVADRTDEVLDAAYACLTRYGVRRTTMDDIAGEMGVSRSAVYQYVRNKDAAFRLLAERLHIQALDRARTVAACDAPAADRVRGVLQAKLDLVLQLRGDSPHTAELLDSKARLFGDICTAFMGELHALLTGLLRESGIANAEDAAQICISLVVGLESTADARRLFARAADALHLGLAVSSPAPPSNA